MSSVILQFTEPVPYLLAPYDHTALTLGEATLPAALQSASTEFMLPRSAFEV